LRNQKLKVVDPKRTLPEDFTIAVDRLPLVTGNIHFIRGVDSRGKISVRNDYFDVGKGYTGELKSVENLVIVCISVACGKVEQPIYLYEHHSSWCSVYRPICKDEINNALRLCQGQPLTVECFKRL
jgi:hypothetical protein